MRRRTFAAEPALPVIRRAPGSRAMRPVAVPTPPAAAETRGPPRPRRRRQEVLALAQPRVAGGGHSAYRASLQWGVQLEAALAAVRHSAVIRVHGQQEVLHKSGARGGGGDGRLDVRKIGMVLTPVGRGPGMAILPELSPREAAEVVEITHPGPQGPLRRVGYVTTPESAVTLADRALIRELRVAMG